MSQRDLPSLNALRAFEATARLGSVSRAAVELHVTHGAVSRQIRVLEDELGQRLFLREGRGLRLTAIGQRLRDAAGAAFIQLQRAVAELRREARPAALVLGCPGSLLARWMIPRLEKLGRDLPDLTLHLAAQEDGFDAELSGLDAALLLAEPPWPRAWQVKKLATEDIGPIVSPRYAGYAALTDTAPTALLGEALLHTVSRPQAWPAWAAQHGLPADALRFGAGFDHLYYLLEAAVAGIGIAIAPRPLVARDLETGRLAAPWGFSTTGGAWILATRPGNDDPRLVRLAEWLKRELAEVS